MTLRKGKRRLVCPVVLLLTHEPQAGHTATTQETTIPITWQAVTEFIVSDPTEAQETVVFPSEFTGELIHYAQPPAMPAMIAPTAPVEAASAGAGTKVGAKQSPVRRFPLNAAGASLALLLGMALLLTAIRQPTSPSQGEEEEQPLGTTEDTPYDIAEARKGMETVRRLLPVAERLAAVVGTPEAQDLLHTVKENIGRTDGAAGAPGAAVSRAPIVNYQASLEALRGLHMAAVTEAERLEGNYDQTPLSAVLDGWDDLSALDKRCGHYSADLHPLVRTLGSLKEVVGSVSSRIELCRRRLNRDQLFKCEQDFKLLEAAAVDLLTLREALEARVRAVHAASEVKDMMQGTVKTVIAGEREQVYELAGTEVQLVHAHAALAMRQWEMVEQTGDGKSLSASIIAQLV